MTSNGSPALLAILALSACGSTPVAPPPVAPAPAPPPVVASPPPAPPAPSWEQAVEPALAGLPPPIQGVIRAAFRRGVGTRPDGVAPDPVYDCNAPVRFEELGPTGAVVLGCGAALWVDERGAPRGYREVVAAGLASGEAAAVGVDPARPHERTVFVSPEGPGATFPVRPEETLGWLFPHGRSFLAVLGEPNEAHERWVAGRVPEPSGQAEPPLLEVRGWTGSGVPDFPGRRVHDAPLALSRDGGWLLDVHHHDGALQEMATGRRLPLPAACNGWLRFFDVEPTTRRFHVAVSNDPRPVFGEVRHCEIDPGGRLLRSRILRPSPGSSCGTHHQCSVSLDGVWLGGAVLSVHEETGMGPLPSDLVDARTGRELGLSVHEARADHVEGFDRERRDVFVTLRIAGGRLARREQRVDDAFRARWEKEREPGPAPRFTYCVVSGVPVPEALCPPEEVSLGR